MDLATILGLSIICGVCMYLFMMLNEKVTKDPDESLGNVISNKISFVTMVITFIVLFSAEQIMDSNSVSESKILTKWE